MSPPPPDVSGELSGIHFKMMEAYPAEWATRNHLKRYKHMVQRMKAGDLPVVELAEGPLPGRSDSDDESEKNMDQDDSEDENSVGDSSYPGWGSDCSTSDTSWCSNDSSGGGWFDPDDTADKPTTSEWDPNAPMPTFSESIRPKMSDYKPSEEVTRTARLRRLRGVFQGQDHKRLEDYEEAAEFMKEKLWHRMWKMQGKLKEAFREHQRRIARDAKNLKRMEAKEKDEELRKNGEKKECSSPLRIVTSCVMGAGE